MTRPTVLHIIDTSGIGGAENVLRRVATGIDPARFRSVVVLPRSGLLKSALESAGIRTYVVKSHRWWDFRLLRGITRICRAERVDVIHAHLPDSNFYAGIAGWLAGCKVVATYHGPVEFDNAHTWRGALKLRVVRRTAASVVAVCDAVKSLLLTHGFPPAQVARIHNGVDIGPFVRARSAGLRESLGWPASTPLVGMVANVRASKGYEYFVRAARRVADADPSVRFLAIGDIDPDIAAPVMRLVRELSLDEQVRFVGYRADVPDAMRDLDVFALSSTSEGFPLVLLEAMASGKAVVTTRCGGTNEIIQDDASGLLVPPGNATLFADAILRVLRDGVLAERLRAGARARANDFTLDGMIAQYESVYDRVLSATPRPRPVRQHEALRAAR